MDDIRSFLIIFLGDMYRIFVTADDSIIAVHKHPLCMTRHEELDLDDLPEEVLAELETRLTQ